MKEQPSQLNLARSEEARVKLDEVLSKATQKGIFGKYVIELDTVDGALGRVRYTQSVTGC